MSKIHTHYDNLKIARNAPDALIKAAYKLLLQQHHPDKVEVAKQAEALRITHIIRGSYDVLSDPVQRAEHDAWIKTQEAQSRSHKPEQPDINVNEAREKEEFRRREAEKVKEEDAKNKTGCLPWIMGLGVVIYFLLVSDKQKRADELVIANQELAFQNSEKQKRAVVNNETTVQPAQANRYHDNGDGTVTFKANGLMWQRCSVGQTWTGETCSGAATEMTWADAMKLTSNFAGHNDWRLPTKDELMQLVFCSDGKSDTDGSCTNYMTVTGPTINTTYFPNTPS
ncbi:MAG: hypothetical protein RL236_1582, partial [Pseudomonadota bacterium]